MGYPGPHGHCEPAPPMHPHCHPAPPMPPMHHCHDIHDMDYSRMHEFVMKLYRLTMSLKDRMDNFDPDGIDSDNSGNNNNTGGNTGGSTGGNTGGSTGNSCKCVVDESITATSANPVQSKAIYNALNALSVRIDKIGLEDGNGNIIAGAVKSEFRQIFIQNKQNPGRPNGGSYEFATRTFIPPTGWKEATTDFTSDIDIWMSYRTFYSDGTISTWSDPIRLIDYQEVFGKIDTELKALYKEIMDKALKELERVEKEADEDLADAKDKINQALQRLSRVEGTYEFVTKVDDDTLGQIRQIAEWVAKENGTVTTILDNIDYVKGELSKHLEKIDTINGTIGTIDTRLSATEAKAEVAAKWVDTNGEIVNTAVAEVDGMKAQINQAVTTANKNTGDIASVRTSLNAVDAAWKVEVAKKTTATDVANQINAAAAKFEVTPEKITAALTNNTGAAAAIVAAINKTGSSVIISADKILLNGEVLARLLGTERLVINKANTVFEPDGSGYVANGNIRWDKDGKISIGDKAIELNSVGQISDISYVVPTIVDNDVKIANMGMSTTMYILTLSGIAESSSRYYYAPLDGNKVYYLNKSSIAGFQWTALTTPAMFQGISAWGTKVVGFAKVNQNGSDLQTAYLEVYESTDGNNFTKKSHSLPAAVSGLHIVGTPVLFYFDGKYYISTYQKQGDALGNTCYWYVSSDLTNWSRLSGLDGVGGINPPVVIGQSAWFGGKVLLPGNVIRSAGSMIVENTSKIGSYYISFNGKTVIRTKDFESFETKALNVSKNITSLIPINQDVIAVCCYSSRYYTMDGFTTLRNATPLSSLTTLWDDDYRTGSRLNLEYNGKVYSFSSYKGSAGTDVNRTVLSVGKKSLLDNFLGTKV